MLDTISKHIRELSMEFDSIPIDPVYLPFKEAIFVALVEITGTLDTYYITGDRRATERSIVASIMLFHDKWQLWLNSLEPGSLKRRGTKTFHEMLLRFSKGCLKAYRAWLIDLQK